MLGGRMNESGMKVSDDHDGEEEVDSEVDDPVIAAAGLITQTDAHGNPLRRATGSNSSIALLQQSRQQELSELAKAKHRQRVKQGNGDSSFGLLCKVLTACLNICCCIRDDDVYSTRRAPPTLLPPQLPEMKGRKTLVLDLDETLVHSSFKPVPNPDYILPVVIEGTTHRVFVLKRPGVDLFLEKLGQLYEIVVFTASLSKYADPLLDMLDINHVIQARLFRESCTIHQGNYVKDLALLGRELKDIIIVDNSPASYLFHPENAIGVSTFIDDFDDRELYYCLPFLESMVNVPDVSKQLHTYPQFILDMESNVANKD